MRKAWVVRRAPQYRSKMSMMNSRSRNIHISGVVAPISRQCVPSQTKWLEMRVTSARITRRAGARGGASTPRSFSTARQ